MCSTCSGFVGDTKFSWILKWQTDGKTPRAPVRLVGRRGKAAGTFLQRNGARARSSQLRHMEFTCESFPHWTPQTSIAFL